MERALTHRITLVIAVFGVAIAGGTFAVAGAHPGIGASIGALVAVANWLAIRWVALRIASGTMRSQRPLMVLLALKMVALAVLCWFLIARWGVDATGFALGISAFVLGILVGSTFTQMAPPAPQGESGSHAPR